MLRAGLRMIQLLPVNDTTVYNMWWDSYPYSSVSVRCHPLESPCNPEKYSSMKMSFNRLPNCSLPLLNDPGPFMHLHVCGCASACSALCSTGAPRIRGHERQGAAQLAQCVRHAGPACHHHLHAIPTCTP